MQIVIKENDICAKIGVWKGDNASQILTKNSQKLHLIDPWVHQGYDGRWYSIEQKKMDVIYDSVLNKFKNNKAVDEFVSDLNINVEIKEGSQFVIPVIRKK